MEERVQNIYQCAVCLKEFSRKSTCKSHMKLHTGERPYECETCGMTFASKSNLNTHILTHTHQKCPTCGKTFTSKPLLKSHMIMHSSERPHECGLCGRCFKRKGELRSHMVTHTGEKRWKCQVCSNLFTERHSLKTHMRLHTGEKPYKCSFCEKTFARKSSYNSHSRLHTGVQPYKCFVCGKKFAHRSVMVSHSRKHMIRECIMCGMNFMKENELTTHVREQHQDDWPHRCNICGVTFTSGTKVKKHMRLHTEAKPFRCNICSRQFLHKSALQSHLLSHSESEGRPTCSICGKSYTAKLSLEIHMRTHTGEKPFMCSVCGKQFTRKSGCISHMRLHTGEKPYDCNICGKKFAYSSGIRSHMKLHNRAECNLCGVKLIGGIDPKNHVTHSIVAVGAKCSRCDIEFKSLSLFKSHLYKHSVLEREEECRKNAETMGIELGQTDFPNEEDLLQPTELPVLVEDETIDKKMPLPEVAMLEAFPNQEDLILSPEPKSDERKRDNSSIPSLMKIKQENVELEDQEFFDTTVLEVTKDDNSLAGLPTFRVSSHQQERAGSPNVIEGSCPSQDFDSHSQEMDFDSSPPVSPLRDIDSLPSTLSPSALSNPASPTPNIEEPVPSISAPNDSEIPVLSITESGDKVFSTVNLASTSKVITISTSNFSTAPIVSSASTNENFTIGGYPHTIITTKADAASSPGKTTHTTSIPKINVLSSPGKSSTIKITSPVKVSSRKVFVKEIKHNYPTSPVIRIMAGKSRENVKEVKHNLKDACSVEPLKCVKVKALGELTVKKKISLPSRKFDIEDLDLANTYSAYVKKMLNLIKPADKQMALIKSLNNTMDNFIEKYQSWK